MGGRRPAASVDGATVGRSARGGRPPAPGRARAGAGCRRGRPRGCRRAARSTMTSTGGRPDRTGDRATMRLRPPSVSVPSRASRRAWREAEDRLARPVAGESAARPARRRARARRTARCGGAGTPRAPRSPRRERGRAREAELAHEAVLERAPEALDAALGLWGSGPRSRRSRRPRGHARAGSSNAARRTARRASGRPAGSARRRRDDRSRDRAAGRTRPRSGVSTSRYPDGILLLAEDARR